MVRVSGLIARRSSRDAVLYSLAVVFVLVGVFNLTQSRGSNSSVNLVDLIAVPDSTVLPAAEYETMLIEAGATADQRQSRYAAVFTLPVENCLQYLNNVHSIGQALENAEAEFGGQLITIGNLYAESVGIARHYSATNDLPFLTRCCTVADDVRPEFLLVDSPTRRVFFRVRIPSQILSKEQADTIVARLVGATQLNPTAISSTDAG